MGAIQDSAELATRNLFKNLSKQFHRNAISAIDHMDDGTPIQLKVTIDKDTGSATFDFTGTGPQVYGMLFSSHLHWCDGAITDFERIRKLECPNRNL